MSPYLKDIIHYFAVPVALGLVLTILKIISDQKVLNFDEANGISLDLILVAIGASGIYLKGKDMETVTAAWAGNLLLAAILLYLRYARARKAAKLAPGASLPETGWLSGTLQLLVGAVSFLWTAAAI
jgi:hypothetical protein